MLFTYINVPIIVNVKGVIYYVSKLFKLNRIFKCSTKSLIKKVNYSEKCAFTLNVTLQRTTEESSPVKLRKAARKTEVFSKYTTFNNYYYNRRYIVSV